ncbi:MAG: hypothetical protein AAFX99_13600 [Myxococcota bacterium]
MKYAHRLFLSIVFILLASIALHGCSCFEDKPTSTSAKKKRAKNKRAKKLSRRKNHLNPKRNVLRKRLPH